MSRNPRRVTATSSAPPVAADMSARAPASRPAPAHLAILAIVIGTQIFTGESSQCSRDGLFPDYDRDCREYTRCAGGAVSGRYSCPAGRTFSAAAGACVPRRRMPCVRRECAPRDTLAYASPGTACKHYYRCENGTAVDRACPAGSWFDLEMQACARGAGTCYEPVCAGLADGEYPDASHECRRSIVCRGGELRAVRPCRGPACAACPPPRSGSAALPAGDADFCSDEACSSLCQSAADGSYADRSSGCREYFVCQARRVIRRGVCEAGHVFSGGGCVARGRAECPPPALSPCFNRADGPHRDWRGCGAWFECRRERVVARGSCGAGLAFDGAACVPAARFPCAGPERDLQCEGLPTGTYQDPDTNCTHYFHCEGALRTTLACAPGMMYDGARCVPAAPHLCPSLERDSCYGRADGRYRGADTGCRGYYACINGEKAVYACPPGKAFDGKTCVPRRPDLCRDDRTCHGRTDGYHADVDSGCRRYFYCEGGDKLATLSCLGGKIFDGQACVETTQARCGGSRHGGSPRCERDGFFVLEGTECSRYYFCVSGARTTLTCSAEQAFNGQVCVSRSQYACPG